MKSKFYNRLTMVLATILMFTFIASSQTTINVLIAEDEDDAEEVLHLTRSITGDVDLLSSDLELGHDGGYAQAVGLRYILPVGHTDTITEAYIQFACDKAHDPSKASVDTLTLKIYAEASDDAAAFTTDSANITMRAKTTAEVLWTPPEWNTNNEVSDTQKTVDISAVIQEVIYRDGWVAGNAIVFVLTPTNPAIIPDEDVSDTMGYREAGAFSDGDGPPKLQVSFKSGPATIKVQVAVDEDDAEEVLHLTRSSTGDVDLLSSDLELGHDGGYAQAVGVRYILPVTKGSIISDAYIQFACDKAHDPSKASVDTLTLKIYAEAADDAAPFTTDSANITSRAQTIAEVLWTPPKWNSNNEVSDTQKTVDISALIQEVVSRDGWNKGNAIVFVLTPTNPPIIPDEDVSDTMGYREAGAFSDGDGPPVLNLTYSGGLPRVLSTDASLASLIIDVGDLVPAFNADSLDYTVELPPGTASATVTASANDFYATVADAETVVDVSSLSGVATVVVTAEDATTRTYKVTMTVSTVGVSDLVDPVSNIRFYHNSLTNQLKVFNTLDVEILDIYSITGKLLNRVRTHNQESMNISTGNLPHGVYVVRMKLSSDRIQTGKFVK
ncbi:T9SS type A sorting domain-containing protein [Bacteroidota bacterium]